MQRGCHAVPEAIGTRPLAIVTMLGILKADCSYIPVDPSSPARRAAKIVQSGAPRVILAGSRTAQLLDELLADASLRVATAVGWLEAGHAGADGEHVSPAFSLEDVRRAPSGPVNCRNTSADAAHILFTSGSTGTPKGVVITHDSLIHLVEWARRYFGIGPTRSEEHTSELQSPCNLVCRLLLE